MLRFVTREAARYLGLRLVMQAGVEVLIVEGVSVHGMRYATPDGLGVGGSIWQAFARRLLPDLAAVAPDLRGHGPHEVRALLTVGADGRSSRVREAAGRPLVRVWSAVRHVVNPHPA